MTNRMWVTVLYFFAKQSHQSCLIPWPTGSEWHCLISLPSCLIPWPTVCESDTALLPCQAVSSIMSHPMTNSMWVTLLYFFARQSHQSCLIPWPKGSEWHCFMSLSGSLINHVSSHDQQYVSDTALFPCQADPSLSLPMINREWVTLWLLYFFAKQSHQSCLIPWPTACEWHCFVSLPGSLINHVSSYDQQEVSDTALFPCQKVSSVMSHPMTNSLWVTLLYFFARQSHQSCLIPWPTGCEWHCYISLSGSLINHVSQGVSDTALFQSHQLACLIPWPTASECHCFISLPGSLINHVS